MAVAVLGGGDTLRFTMATAVVVVQALAVAVFGGGDTLRFTMTGGGGGGGGCGSV